jgi:virginiamycin A acetyltransferase
MPILDANIAHPITLPDGTIYSDTVYLKNVVDHPRMEIGDYSYYTHSGKPEDTAQILAITSSANHPMTGFTTYPFRIFKPETFGYKDLPVKDTVVGHDVWIGHDAVIMPGVQIGPGAIVAAASVVTRNVPAYSVVGGNPATVIRMRYSTEIIDELLDIAWWDWSLDKIEANLVSLENGDIEALRLA